MINDSTQKKTLFVSKKEQVRIHFYTHNESNNEIMINFYK